MDTNEDKRPTTFAEVTDAMLNKWKKAFPKGIFLLEVEDETKDTGKKDKRGKAVMETSYKRGYVHQPTRENLKYAMTLMKEGGELGMVEALLEEMWLGGDQEILEDDEFFLGACSQLQELVQVKAASLKKL